MARSRLIFHPEAAREVEAIRDWYRATVDRYVLPGLKRLLQSADHFGKIYPRSGYTAVRNREGIELETLLPRTRRLLFEAELGYFIRGQERGDYVKTGSARH